MLIVIPGSGPLYAPGKLTVAGRVLPPPVISSCAHSICGKHIADQYQQFRQGCMSGDTHI
jgi:hypothetical protein